MASEADEISSLGMTNLFDWFPGNSALTFARPWLLLLLLAIPLLAWLRGKTRAGCGADVFVYSESASDRKTKRRAGR